MWGTGRPSDCDAAARSSCLSPRSMVLAADARERFSSGEASALCGLGGRHEDDMELGVGFLDLGDEPVDPEKGHVAELAKLRVDGAGEAMEALAGAGAVCLVGVVLVPPAPCADPDTSTASGGRRGPSGSAFRRSARRRASRPRGRLRARTGRRLPSGAVRGVRGGRCLRRAWRSPVSARPCPFESSRGLTVRHSAEACAIPWPRGVPPTLLGGCRPTRGGTPSRSPR